MSREPGADAGGESGANVRLRLFVGDHRPVLLSLVAIMGLASYNNLSVTAALPDIGDDLGSVALLPWVVTVELLGAAVATLVVGPYVDGAGVSRAFRLTIVAFIVTSALCAAAPTMELLVAARLAQGLATGAVIGISLTSVGLCFPAELRPRVYALVSSVWGLMGLGGPAIAAVLVSALGWRAVFWVNLPVAVIAGWVGWSRLPTRAASIPERTDRRGLLLVSAVTSALLLSASYPEWWSLLLLGSGVALIASYVRHARRHPSPIVRLAHIVGPRWRLLHITATAAVAGGTGASVFLPLYLRGARGASAAGAAFAVLWPTLGWSSAAWAASKLQDRMPAQPIALLGSVVIASSSTAVALLVYAEAPVPLLLAAFFGVGAGIGTITNAALSLLQRRAEDHEMGRVSSAHQFVRSLGFAYGAAISGLVLVGVVEFHIGDVEAVRDLLGGEDIALGTAAVDALSSAYTWSASVAAVIAMTTVPGAIALVRSRRDSSQTADV